MSGQAVLLCGHGSRDVAAVREFEAVAAALRERVAPVELAAACLEFARPTITEGLAMLSARGARHILAVPAMLHGAGHVRNDLPREIGAYVVGNPQARVSLGRDLAGEAKLIEAAADRVAAAAPGDRRDTSLVVVGRGTGILEADAGVAEIARRLGDRLGFGAVEAAFSGLAGPPVDAVLDRTARRGFRSVVVFPYFLFAGVLVRRIDAETREAAGRYPGVSFRTAHHLGDHPQVVGALLDRIAAFLAGEPLADERPRPRD